jgi:hypothetical protein
LPSRLNSTWPASILISASGSTLFNRASTV